MFECFYIFYILVIVLYKKMNKFEKKSLEDVNEHFSAEVAPS